MTDYSFLTTYSMMELLVHDEMFRDELEEALKDESGETLVASVLFDAYPEASEEQIVGYARIFASELLIEAAALVDTVETDKEVLLTLRTLLGEDKELRRSFTLREAHTLVQALRAGEVASLSILDQLTGSYLIIKALSRD
jgi:hypothetical protein